MSLEEKLERKLAGLKKVRTTIHEQMIKMRTFAQQIKAETDSDEVIVKQNRVNDMFKKYSDIEQEIFLINAEEPSEILIFEDIYYEVITKLTKWSRQSNVEGGSGHNNTLLNSTINGEGCAQVKLPKINIAPFSGDYMEWQSFYDLYTSSIHGNVALTPSQKFQYLKGLLRGEAASLIKHFAITEANYNEAFKKLRDRYDRKKHTVNAFIRTFLEQPSIGSNVAVNIRKLLNTSDEIIRGLRALGAEAESRDPWLIFILLNKVDDETRNLWSQQTSNQDFIKFEEFLVFLNNRSDALESMKSSGKQSTANTRIKTIESTRAYALNTIACGMCKSSEHMIYQCKQFLEQPIEQRRAIIKDSGRCFNCLSDSHSVYQCKSRKSCHICRKRHHTALHVQPDTKQQISASNTISTEKLTVQNTCLQASSMPIQSTLPTALIRVQDQFGNRVLCRVLLDTGSQLSFISETCMQRLKLPRRHGRITVSGIGQCKIESRGIVSLSLTGRTDDSMNIDLEAYILPKITTLIPPSTRAAADIKLLANIQLADPDNNSPRSVDILLGANIVFDILSPENIKNSDGKIIAQNTLLGWILVGRQQGFEEASTALLTTVRDQSPSIDVDKCLRAFWEIEEIIESKPKLTTQEEICENHFVNNTTRDSFGRFIVRLPFKTPKPIIGNSQQMAIKRLLALERRFQQDESFARSYREFIKEYMILGHMKQIRNEKANRDDYVFLPHHGVLKQESTTTKLRVVFDASAKGTNKFSLNDTLLAGPNIQSSIYEILLRFREHAFVLSADIEKMYRQILVDERDQHSQCIIWRDDTNKQMSLFQLQTLTYGTVSAPFLATRVIEELAKQNQHQFPEASRSLHRDMYVDDLMTGTNCLEEAINLKENLITILNQAGMKLRKFSSNSTELLETIAEERRANQSKEIRDSGEGSCLKVLGVNWNPHNDNFQFTVALQRATSVTKRIILSESSKIFDPLGWLAPSTIRFKILLQALWLSNFNWDDKLPSDVEERWNRMREDMNQAAKIIIPRWLLLDEKVNHISIHAFCDASELAYAAVAYLRVTYTNGCCSSRLITAKTKVAPIKQVSIPRLELCASVLLVRLVESITASTTFAIESITAWTDSKIVLDWLSSHPRRWSTFVGNRTSQVIQKVSRSNWRHVPSKSNPADCASRGISAELLHEHKQWWLGPDWLVKDESHWPAQKTHYDTKEEERPPNMYAFTSSSNTNLLESIIEAYSSYQKIIVIISWIYRFTNNCRATKPKIAGPLTRDELSCSENILIKYVQSKFFTEEIKALTHSKPILRHSKILPLAPFIDDIGILRVGGRIDNSVASFEIKHPAILPYNSNLVKLLIREAHIYQGHAGLSFLSNTLKQRFWIVRAKTMIREIIKRCTVCSRYQPRILNEVMADLPGCRVKYERPFLHVGIDYAGPILTYQRRGRGQKPQKSYIALFVCTSIKAVHVELVNDLTTESFLAALRRFISRRGIPTNIYSDNGSNFSGANRELKEVFSLLNKNSNTISNFLLKDRINWHFNPPLAPHFGGLWEAAVKSLKFHLKRIIGNQILTNDELYTILTQVEAMLNSRPLCKASNDEFDVLTPAHFLIGHSANYIPEVDITTTKIPYNSRWKIMQQICQHFWSRWHKEYLTTLQKRSKWLTSNSDVNLNDIMLLRDERTPPSKWLLGRIQKLFPGSDGKIRVVELFTKTGILKRPITKLVKLAASD